jgi:hypothetical protein
MSETLHYVTLRYVSLLTEEKQYYILLLLLPIHNLQCLGHVVCSLYVSFYVRQEKIKHTATQNPVTLCRSTDFPFRFNAQQINTRQFNEE